MTTGHLQKQNSMSTRLKIRNYTLLLLLALISLLPFKAMAEDSDEFSNPVYIGALLLDEPAERDMAKLCEYYGFTPSGTDDSFTLFTRSDGTEIRFRIEGSGDTQTPVVEVTANQDTRETHKDLEQLRYEPVKKGARNYRKGTKLANRYSTATLTGDRTRSHIRFTKHRTH